MRSTSFREHLRPKPRRFSATGASGVEKVIVQHVSVSDGGQAIVGNVTRPAHEKALRKRVRGTPVLGDARQSPMDVIGEPERVQVPLRRANG